MDRTFSNTDAAICGAVAICEFIFLIVYITTTSIKLRKKIISNGRLIPNTIQILTPGLAVTTGHTIQISPTNPYHNFQQVPSTQPPPPGFYQNFDSPPPYSFGNPQRN